MRPQICPKCKKRFEDTVGSCSRCWESLGMPPRRGLDAGRVLLLSVLPSLLAGALTAVRPFVPPTELVKTVAPIVLALAWALAAGAWVKLFQVLAYRKMIDKREKRHRRWRRNPADAPGGAP